MSKNIEVMLDSYLQSYYICRMFSRLLCFSSIILICCTAYLVSAVEHGRTNYDKEEIVLQRLLDDNSLSNLTHGHKFIFFYTGHHNLKWSMIIDSGTGFSAYYGYDNFIGKESLQPLQKYDTVIKWGLGSLSSEANSMQAIPQENFSTIYNQLYVCDKASKVTFALNNAKNFSGPDSIEFNSRLESLKLVMCWISSPELRPYLEPEQVRP